MLKGFLVGAVIGTVISVTGLLATSYFLGQDTGGVVEQAQEAERPDPVAAPSPDPAPAAAPEPEPQPEAQPEPEPEPQPEPEPERVVLPTITPDAPVAQPAMPPVRPRHPCQSPKICLRSWPTQRRFLHRNLCRFSQSCFMMIPNFR